MRYMVILLVLLVAPSCFSPKVDAGLVGTWELNVPNADGVARWVWEIHPEGSYAFRAEGPGGVPSHRGVLQARNGNYVLRSTTMLWVDTGTYRLMQGNTLSATGKLGTASWTRVQPVQARTSPGSSSAPSADTRPGRTPTEPGGSAGGYAAISIYQYLSHHTFDDRLFTAPWKLTRTVIVDPDAQDQRDGVIGIVQAKVQGSVSPATMTFIVYRDRAAAEAARDVNAMYDARTFRMKPGEFVSSHAYTHGERGEARCLSRLLVNSSSTATVTCYLLVQYPTREPVMIVSEVSEQVAAKSQEASSAAVERANDLLFVGLKEWALVYPAIRGGDPR
jgi:hypothetical protein